MEKVFNFQGRASWGRGREGRAKYTGTEFCIARGGRANTAEASTGHSTAAELSRPLAGWHTAALLPHTTFREGFPTHTNAYNLKHNTHIVLYTASRTRVGPNSQFKNHP